MLLKVALRQTLRRLHEESDFLSQYEALAGNLGWEKVSEALAAARSGVSQAAERTADAAEAAAVLQAESAHAHAHLHSHSHSHPHQHVHEHSHSHPHQHEHDAE